jgi:hypothetical protein
MQYDRDDEGEQRHRRRTEHDPAQAVHHPGLERVPDRRSEVDPAERHAAALDVALELASG